MTVFIRARNYTPHAGSRDIWWIVIHDMEYPERPDGAEWCARYFAGPSAPQASAHYCVDNNSIVQSVALNDIAWHAPPNSHSIGIEHAGYSAQSRADWLDSYSETELRLSAGLVYELCKRFSIPVRWLTVADLRAGKKGITSHANISEAFHMTNHRDPGVNFPVGWYLGQILAKGKVPRIPDKDGRRIVAPYLQWKEWRLGEGAFKGHDADPRTRPPIWKAAVPASYWPRLKAFLAARAKGQKPPKA